MRGERCDVELCGAKQSVGATTGSKEGSLKGRRMQDEVSAWADDVKVVDRVLVFRSGGSNGTSRQEHCTILCYSIICKCSVQ